MAQQQQSNMVKPQKIGGVKRPMGEQPVGGMDGLYPSEMKRMSNLSKTLATKAPKMVKSPAKTAKPKKAPTYSQVQKSVRKTMGY